MIELFVPSRLRYPRGGFTPTVSLVGLIYCWWNAADLSDGAVTTWTDRIGGVAPTQGTAGARPVCAATSHNNRAGVTFDAVDDVLITTTLGALPVGSTPSELWSAFNNQQPASTNVHLFQYGGTGASTHRTQRFSRNAAGIPTRFVMYDGGAISSDIGNDALGYHVAQVAFDGVVMTGRFDGRLTRPSSTAISSLSTVATRATIGAANSATPLLFFGGSIRHILVTQILTALQRLQLEAWLAWDSGCPEVLLSDHPFRNGMP